MDFGPPIPVPTRPATGAPALEGVLEQPTERVPEGHRGRRRLHPSRLLLYVALSAYCLTSVGAFVWTISVSLKTNPEFFSSSPWSLPKQPQLGNYREAWSTANIGRFFLNSGFVTVVSVSVALVLSAMASYVLARVRFRGNGILTGVFMSGLMVPPFLMIVPLYFLLRDMHLLGSLLGLIVVYIAIQIPFSVYVLIGFFRTLPHELEEAAYVDGASMLKTFFRVMLPLAAPGLASVALLNALTIWNEFFFALVLLNDENRFTLPLGLFRLSINAEYSAQWTQLFAGLVMAMIPVLVLFAIAQERITRGLTLGALKG